MPILIQYDTCYICGMFATWIRCIRRIGIPVKPRRSEKDCFAILRCFVAPLHSFNSLCLSAWSATAVHIYVPGSTGCKFRPCGDTRHGMGLTMEGTGHTLRHEGNYGGACLR